MVLDYFRWFWILTMGNTLCDGHGMAFQFDWDEEFPLRWYPMGARDTPIVWYHVVLPPISSHVRSISDPFRYKKKYGVLWFLDWGNSSDIKGCLQGIPPKKIEAMIFTHPRRPEEDLRLQIKVPWRTEVSPPIVDPGGYVLNTSPLVLKKNAMKRDIHEIYRLYKLYIYP